MMVREAGGGLRQGARRHLRLRGDGDAHAHRHADHRAWLPAHRHGQVGTVGEYTFAIFAGRRRALVISWWRVGLPLLVPYLGTLLLHDQAAWRMPPAARAVRHAVLHALPRAGDWCVKHRWITIGLTVATLARRHGRHGPVQNQFFPDSSRLRSWSTSGCPEGTSFAANEEVARASRRGSPKPRDVAHVTTWVGSGAERFALVIDQIFPQSNVAR